MVTAVKGCLTLMVVEVEGTSCDGRRVKGNFGFLNICIDILV